MSGVEPLRILAGDTSTWTRLQANYLPGDGWALTYYFGLGSEVKTVDTTPSENGQGYDAVLSSKDWAPGLWRWAACVSKGTERYTVGEGVTTVAPDPSSDYDRRTHPERCLAAIEAVIEGRMSDPIIEYEIDGVKAKKLPHAELLALRAHYRAIVKRQAGASFFTPVAVRFP